MEQHGNLKINDIHLRIFVKYNAKVLFWLYIFDQTIVTVLLQNGLLQNLVALCIIPFQWIM